MKRTLIAMAAVAAMAACGAAMAQSSVTAYGRVDLSLGSLKELGKGSQTRMFDGHLTSTRLGFRGTEDLGGGLKASFKLEHRFDADTGASEEPMWKGESTVSLSGGFGEIKLGRSSTIYDEVRGLSASSSVFDSAFTPSSNGVFGSGGDYSSRFNNKITYVLPAMGNFYGGLDHALDEDASAKADMTGAKLGYKSGPLNLAVGLQKERGKENDYVMVSAAYDLGVVSVSGGYNVRKGNAASGDDQELTFGVNVPLGAFQLSAGFATGKTETAGATTSKASGFGVGATYALSKRTKLYGGVRSHQIKDGSGTKTADARLFAVGIRHDF